MTTLFVIQFLTLAWVAALSVGAWLVVAHVRTTRRAVVAAFRGAPNPLRLPPHPPAVVPDPPVRPRPGPDDVVAAPPTVRGDTVRDWLMYYTNRERCWNDAVAELYRRAAADPVIAAYFVGVDLDRLQRHFTAAMVLVTSAGVTHRTVRTMTLAHADVRTPAGTPITGAVYDRVVDLLVTVLVGFGVPDPAINELRHVVEPLRAAVVAE